MSEPLRVAMWSGPRNISTAMMRAWENREDCVVSELREDHLRDEFLALHIKLQLDVVALHFIDVLFECEVIEDDFTSGVGRLDGSGEHVVHWGAQAIALDAARR